MNHRADYLLQVLEKIGSPLLASVIEVNARMHNTQLTAEAQKIAELLARTVQTGIDLGYALDLGPSGQITDSLRLAMTGLAAPLIAGSFRNNGKTPTDTDIKKIITAMQAVLSFAENFSADSDHSDRLKNLNPGDGASDAAQNYLRNVYAFVPVVNVDGLLYNEQTVPGGGGMWRKNRRVNGNGSFGVDINRNFSTGWGLDNGSSSDGSQETYRGTAAFSEPEALAQRDCINAIQPKTACLLHSVAGHYLIPYTYNACFLQQPIKYVLYFWYNTYLLTYLLFKLDLCKLKMCQSKGLLVY